MRTTKKLLWTTVKFHTDKGKYKEALTALQSVKDETVAQYYKDLDTIRETKRKIDKLINQG